MLDEQSHGAYEVRSQTQTVRHDLYTQVETLPPAPARKALAASAKRTRPELLRHFPDYFPRPFKIWITLRSLEFTRTGLPSHKRHCNYVEIFRSVYYPTIRAYSTAHVGRE